MASARFLLRSVLLERGLSLRAAGTQLELSAEALRLLVHGYRQPSAALRERIAAWTSEIPATAWPAARGQGWRRGKFVRKSASSRKSTASRK